MCFCSSRTISSLIVPAVGCTLIHDDGQNAKPVQLKRKDNEECRPDLKQSVYCLADGAAPKGLRIGPLPGFGANSA